MDVTLVAAIRVDVLDPLTRKAVLAAMLIVFVVRPLAGLIGFAGFERDFAERATISFYGVRGIGSFYYLAYGLNAAAFPGTDLLWRP